MVKERIDLYKNFTWNLKPTIWKNKNIRLIPLLKYPTMGFENGWKPSLIMLASLEREVFSSLRRKTEMLVVSPLHFWWDTVQPMNSCFRIVVGKDKWCNLIHNLFYIFNRTGNLAGVFSFSNSSTSNLHICSVNQI